MRQALGDVDTLGKVRVLAAVADRGEPSALPLVRSAAQDTAQPVRAAALLALGKIGDSSVVMFLAETAANDASQVRRRRQTPCAPAVSLTSATCSPPPA